MYKFLYSFLYLVLTHSHTNIAGMLIFVTIFSIVPILKSSFLHRMKLLLFLMNALTFGDITLSVKHSELNIFLYV